MAAVADNVTAEITWDDVVLDDTGAVATICAQPISSYNYKQLRSIASNLKVKGVKNASKATILSVLANYKTNKEVYNLEHGTNDSNRKTIHCPFCLLNILFSDDYADLFSTLGDKPTRLELDEGGNVGNNEKFWKSVANDFVDDNNNNNYNLLLFNNPALEGKGINPSKIVRHDWTKLCTM